jgi:hypothetical protein
MEVRTCGFIHLWEHHRLQKPAVHDPVHIVCPIVLLAE